jgi:hypothetical protein
MPRRVDVLEKGESPLYYRLYPPDTLEASGRVDLGTATRLALNGATSQTAFRFDVLAGVVLAPRKRSIVGIVGEGGYSFVGFSENYFTCGLGLMLRKKQEDWQRPAGSAQAVDMRSFWDTAWIALVPRGLLGSDDGELGVGLRTGLSLGVENTGIELAHQYVSTPTRSVQELQIALVWYPVFPDRLP